MSDLQRYAGGAFSPAAFVGRGFSPAVLVRLSPIADFTFLKGVSRQAAPQ
jgi:hypothetical protein